MSDAIALLGACAWPSEAYWRLLELQVVRTSEVLAPVLELGCGDGAFTERAGLRIDLAVDREPRAVQRAAARPAVYGHVVRADIRELRPEDFGLYRTVFANSVLEHIPGIDSVIKRCRELLVPGGQLIATVPLREMNAHLALPGGLYARSRQRQLQHRNLWSLAEWSDRFRAAGFVSVSAKQYLDSAACRRWDALDLVGTPGVGRYRVSTAAHRLASISLPDFIKHRLKRRMAGALVAWTCRQPAGPSCAAMLIAGTSE